MKIILKSVFFIGFIATSINCSNIAALATTIKGKATFQGIGSLPASNFGSVVGGISDNGLIVVGGSGLPGDEAFRWTQNTGLIGIGDLPGGSFTSWAEGTSADGSVIVGQSDSADGFQSYRWTEETGMVGLGFLSGGTFSGASAVSNNGSVVIGQSENSLGQMEAYRWTEETGMVGLGFLPGGSASEAFALSADGSVVVGQSESVSGVEAFLWTEKDGIISLGGLSAFRNDVACAITADGLIIFGGAVSDPSNPFTEAFIWTETGGMVGLGDLPGGDFSSIVFGTSADGSIAVGNSLTDLGEEAFIWDPINGMRNFRDVLVNNFNLDLTDWTLTNGVAVSANGQTVTGTGINPDGEIEGWVVTFTPVPEHSSALTLLAFGTLGTASTLKRRLKP